MALVASHKKHKVPFGFAQGRLSASLGMTELGWVVAAWLKSGSSTQSARRVRSSESLDVRRNSIEQILQKVAR